MRERGREREEEREGEREGERERGRERERLMPKCKCYTVLNVRTRPIQLNHQIKNAPIGFCTRLLDSTWYESS